MQRCRADDGDMVIEALGRVWLVRKAHPLVSAFRQLFPGWTVHAQTGAFAEVLATVEPAPADTGWDIRSYVGQTRRCACTADAAQRIHGIAIHAALARGDFQAVLHGAAVRRPSGQAYLLLGAGGAGKSTLALLMIAQGWRLIGDDLVGVSRDHRNSRTYLHALGMAPKLRWPGPPDLGSAMRWAVERRATFALESGVYVTLRGDETWPCGETVPLARAFVLERKIDNTNLDGPAVSPTSRAERVRAFATSLMSAVESPAAQLDQAVAFAETIDCELLRYQSSRAAARYLEADQPGCERTP